MKSDLTVRVVTATRDRHITSDCMGLSYEALDPGGGTTATFTLTQPRDEWPDITGARLFIYDAATTQVVWDGWIDYPGESHDAAQQFEVTAQGPSILASQKTRALWYIDTGFENYNQNVVSNHRGTHVVGGNESVGDIPGFESEEDLEAEGEEAPQAIVNQIPSGTVIGNGHYVGLRWTGADGAEMKIRAYSYKAKAGFTVADGWAQRICGWGSAADIKPSTTERTQAQVRPSAFASIHFLLRRISGGATTIPNDNYWGAWYDPLVKAELMDRHGNPVVPTLERSWELTAVVEDLVGRMIPDLDPDLTTIEKTPYQIDQLLYLDSARATDVLDDLKGFEPDYTWTIDYAASPHQGRGFHWRKTPTTVRYEISETDGTEFPGGDNEIATEAVVFWTDEASGFSRKQRIVVQADPLSPAWIHAGGRTLSAEPVTLEEGKGSKKNAQRAAQVVLDTHQEPTRSGTAAVARSVRDLQAGAEVPPWGFQVGELVRVRETGEVLPITGFSYSDDDGAATLTLGKPAADMEDLLAAIPDA